MEDNSDIPDMFVAKISDLSLLLSVRGAKFRKAIFYPF